MTAAVLTNQESEQIFGVDLALQWVQAVWVEVENRDNHNYWLLSSALDPDYYAPSEIAYNSHHWLSPGVNDRMDDRFRQLSFRNPITPGSVVAGFFFVNLDQDNKEVDIDLVSREQAKFFTFFFQVEALRANSMFDVERQHSQQDVAFQKARGTIHQRNHLRLWLTPMRFSGKEVWVGSISRDIGVHFTAKPGHFVTHKIDEDIDEVRNSFAEDMLVSQGLKKLGWAKGMPAVSSDKPRLNLGGDPYFTDGLLLVLLFHRRPISILEVQFFDWEKPVGRHM